MGFLLHHLLSETAVKFPDRKAILFNEEVITYAELDQSSNQIANVLIGAGVKRGDRVGIYMSRCINSIIAIFGILKAGAAYVPIDPLSPENRLNYIVNKCGIEFAIISQEKLSAIEKAFPQEQALKKILVLGSSFASKNEDHYLEILSWSALKAASSDKIPAVQCINTDLCYILFTSGSTGVPKGVMISHLNALTFINMAADFCRIKPEDVFANISPLHFDLSVFDIFVAVKAGATIVIVPDGTSLFPSKIAEFIQQSKITVWNSVPSTLSLLTSYANINNYNLASLRLVLFAGEVFPVKYLRKLKQSLPAAQFYNIYGQTEANSSTYYLVQDIPQDDSMLIPIGKPFPNFDVFALDENGKIITENGQKGELFVRSASVASGYWGEPEKTRDKFVQNPVNADSREYIYRTGDIVRLDQDGNYVFIGRVDHMIKSRGYRIEIGEIEMILSSHANIKTAVVLPIPDDLIGNRITAVIIPSIQNDINKEDIKQYCAQKLPKYMVPEIIELRDSLPVTSSGKIDRKKLTELMSNMLSHR